ncbi:MAG TPA: carboxypeptidase-like regulatory domain-containing protein [Cyclobacteriaceae bacterium]|jgi:TonB family protein|nr:carboxypeptidase-like regulatory domain-containing protein [Cyclobacteriaceae bacterium]
MGSLSDDIIKYKKGELNPEQMHALEKKALADPFLAEALEGVENISAEEFAADISEIEKNILHKKNPARTGIFTPLRIAAGVLLVASSIFIVYQFVPRAETIALKTEKPKPEKKKESERPSAGSGKNAENVQSEKLKAENESSKERKKTEPSVSNSRDLAFKPDHHQNKQPANKQNAGEEIQQPAQVTPEAQEQKAKVEIQSVPQAAPIQDLAVVEERSLKTETEDDKVSKEIVAAEPKAAGASATSQDKKMDSESRAKRLSVPRAKAKIIQSISGQVIAAEDGSPLPGVSVNVKGTSIGTVTDLKGNYTISIEGENLPLVFSFIGLQQQEVDAAGKDKINVKMKEDATQLSEVVVTGFGSAKDEDREPVITLAEPIGGKKAYDNYLESNLRYPEEALKNKIKGKAGIEFTVSTDGSLKDFQVIKKLGYGCEEEIIRLVKEGPKWIPSKEDNIPTESTVRVRMRFDPTKSGR